MSQVLIIILFYADKQRWRSSIQKNVYIIEINGTVKSSPPALGDEHECDLGLYKIYIVYVNAYSL